MKSVLKHLHFPLHHPQTAIASDGHHAPLQLMDSISAFREVVHQMFREDG